MSVTAAEYGGGKAPIDNHDEAVRLMDSADYAAGWKAAHANFAEYVEHALLNKDPGTIRSLLHNA